MEYTLYDHHKRYRTWSGELRRRYGQKVCKIPLNAGFGCPNRDGTCGISGCTYCSGLQSGDFGGDPSLSIEEQFAQMRAVFDKKWPGAQYIAYFQAGTNTYAPVDVLQSFFEPVLAFPDVVGLAVATRADCLPEPVLDYLAEKPNVILATGHGSRDEIDALIHAAAERGIKRILANHPHYMIGASIEDMVAWSKLGAYIELNAVAFVPDSKFHTHEIEEARNIVAAVGVDKIVLDSDYGQNGNGSPVTGLTRFICMLQEVCGLTDEQMEVMTYHNPAWLLGMEER